MRFDPERVRKANEECWCALSSLPALIVFEGSHPSDVGIVSKLRAVMSAYVSPSTVEAAVLDGIGSRGKANLDLLVHKQRWLTASDRWSQLATSTQFGDSSAPAGAAGCVDTTVVYSHPPFTAAKVASTDERAVNGVLVRDAVHDRAGQLIQSPYQQHVLLSAGRMGIAIPEMTIGAEKWAAADGAACDLVFINRRTEPLNQFQKRLKILQVLPGEMETKYCMKAMEAVLAEAPGIVTSSAGGGWAAWQRSSARIHAG
jgi:hypothetical protein